MGEQQQWRLATVPLDAGDEILPPGRGFEDLCFTMGIQLGKHVPFSRTSQMAASFAWIRSSSLLWSGAFIICSWTQDTYWREPST